MDRHNCNIRHEATQVARREVRSDALTCSQCGASVPRAVIQLSAEYAIVCGECYLKNPPAEDVEGVLAALEMGL